MPDGGKAASAREELIRKLVDGAPPLTEDQIARLRTLLGGSGG